MLVVYLAPLRSLRYFDHGRLGVFLPHSADQLSGQRRAFDPELPIHLERSGRLRLVVFPHGSELPLSTEPSPSPLTAKLEGPMVAEHIPEFDATDHPQSKRAFRNSRCCLPIHFDPFSMLERFLCGTHYFRQTDLRSDNFISRIPVRFLDTGLAEGGADKRVSLAGICNMNIDIPYSIPRQKHGTLVVHYLASRFPVWIKGFGSNRNPRPLFAYKRINLSFDRPQRSDSNADSYDSCQEQEKIRKIIRRNESVEIALRLIFGPICFFGGCLFLHKIAFPAIDSYWGWDTFLYVLFGMFLVALGIGCFVLPVYWQEKYHQTDNCQPSPHNSVIVSQKYLLTSDNYWDTVIGIRRTVMANVLPMEKRIAVIGALAEGSAIRQIERVTGINRNTIMNLGVSET